MPKRAWYYKDPEDPTFTVVTYERPLWLSRRYERKLLRSKERAESIREMCRDPLVKFEHEKYMYERQSLKRYRRDPRYVNLSNAEILSMVRAYYSVEYPPVILGKSKSDSEMSVKRRGPGVSRLRRVEKLAEAGITNVRYFARDFVSVVSQRRQELNWTQSELALRINVPESTIGALERGELPFDGELKGKLTVELKL